MENKTCCCTATLVCGEGARYEENKIVHISLPEGSNERQVGYAMRIVEINPQNGVYVCLENVTVKS